MTEEHASYADPSDEVLVNDQHEDEPVSEAEAQLEARLAARRQERAVRSRTMLQQARSVFRTMEGWETVQDETSWLQVVADARQRSTSGRFLVEQLGARRHLDPRLTATLWDLRQQLIAELTTGSAAERMLVDMAVIAYAQTLQFQRWTGDLALTVEHELFGRTSPSASFSEEHGNGTVRGLRVEEHLQRLGEQLLPLMDRSQRMLLRGLRELRRPQAPSVAIAQAGQVNVGTVQQNTAQVAEPEGGPGAARRDRRAPAPRVVATPDTLEATQRASRKNGTRGTRREGTQP